MIQKGLLHFNGTWRSYQKRILDNLNFLQLLWERYIGKCDVVYTRNLEGRKVLLRARRDASSASKRESSKRLSKWQ